MKKALKIMAMVLFVVGMTALTSCTKSKEKMILGKWELEKVSASMGGYTFQITANELISMLEAYEGEFEDVDEVILEFKNDGYVYFQGDGARYVLEGDKLTLEAGEDTLEATIIELTDSSLTLEGTESEFDEETGMTMKITFNLYFKRV